MKRTVLLKNIYYLISTREVEWEEGGPRTFIIIMCFKLIL